MRVCFYTLGCKVNLNETGALEHLFRQAGFEIVPQGQEADVYVVNSCTVTNFGDQKSRKWLRRQKREHPQAVTVLTGCYPQAFPGEASNCLEADLVCGNGDRHAILENVQKLLSGHERIVSIRPHGRGERFEELPVERFESHTRAFLKIEDGCNRQCAYCVIPRARGPVRSRSEESILNELHTLAAAGYREAVLSGISLPSYGQDTGTDLVTLLEKCDQVPGIERIRLGSLDPDMLKDSDIVRLSRLKKLCPQFHLSLQSGCTATLRRMRRVYTAEEYAGVVEKLRAAFGGADKVSFTTDCICGFPGESEEDFAESCAFIDRIGFLKVHVFPYSRRSGTPAYDFEGQICEREKQARSRRMSAAAEKVRVRVLEGLVGSEDDVLLETALSKTVFTGYTRLYVPVVVSAPGHKGGEIVRVRLGAYDGEHVHAELSAE
jgi:threonylcarbamoyladenosine tRNA methylthiotransferase MtaB